MSNAVRAKSWAKNFQFAYTVDGGEPTIKWYDVATGETILKGDPLVLSSGDVAEGASDSGALFGIAGADGDAGDSIPVYVGDRRNVFLVQTDGDYSAKTYPFECDIVADGDYWVADIGASVEDVLHCIGKPDGDEDDDTTDPGRVYCMIKRSEFDALVAAR